MNFTSDAEATQPVKAERRSRRFVKKFDLDKLFTKSDRDDKDWRPTSSSSVGGQVSDNLSTLSKSPPPRRSNSLIPAIRVDKLMKKDSARHDAHVKILALGMKPWKLVKQVRYASAAPPTPADFERYRQRIVENVVRTLLAVIGKVSSHTLTADNIQLLAATQTLSAFAEAGGPKWTVSEEASKAAKIIWSSNSVQACLLGVGEVDVYYLRATERIMEIHYRPTIADIIKVDEEPTTMSAASFYIDNIEVELFHTPQAKVMRLIHHHEDADAIVFCLDLSTYDHYPEDSGRNAIEQCLSASKQNLKFSSSASKPVFLMFTNAASFRRKIMVSPFQKHFPSSGAKDFESAVAYLVRRFRQTFNCDILYHHCANDDAEDDSVVEFFQKSVRELPNLLTCVKAMDELVGMSSFSSRASRRMAT